MEADPNRIKMSWLVRLHWGALAGQIGAVLVVISLDLIHMHVVWLGVLFAVEALANLALDRWLRRAPDVLEKHLVGVMVVDSTMLTVILSVTGSYSNPFSTLYLVNVALAAVLLSPRHAWMLLGASLLLFGSLFALDSLRGTGWALSDYDHMELMRLHMEGMWVAFAIAAAFIVYIVGRVTHALHGLERQLTRERSLSARKDKVASLATLAAGAAHELSTPLATIAVVTRELERALEKEAPSGAKEDLTLIRQQLGRCQEILQQMSAYAGENAGETMVSITLGSWAERALSGLPSRDRVKVRGMSDLEAYRVEGPARGLARALRSLLKNAIQASPPGMPVELRLSASGDEVVAEVADSGGGMPQEILDRAGEPFFTTKVPGEGMGLGLFLTRTLAEQLGGQLELVSEAGKGTTARLRLPAALSFKGGTS
ncbi:MAG: HAMP domain-containing histidine kinase [Deltaproteobacteria bacterium]|nr:HAMP domain-containing histidine kinase [Deltaproteobacteria bacterium]